MDPRRKRKIRLVAALSAAVLLAVALVYTSFAASVGVKTPSQLVDAAPGTKALVEGEVVPGSIHKRGGDSVDFRVVDIGGKGQSLPVSYTGEIPDAFRGGREIVLHVTTGNGALVGEPDTLSTKCPSKYTTSDS